MSEKHASGTDALGRPAFESERSPHLYADQIERSKLDDAENRALAGEHERVRKAEEKANKDAA